MTDGYKYSLVGNYVYQCYQEKTGGIDISEGQKELFDFVLGWTIKDIYPDAFDWIFSDVIKQKLSV